MHTVCLNLNTITSTGMIEDKEKEGNVTAAHCSLTERSACVRNTTANWEFRQSDFHQKTIDVSFAIVLYICSILITLDCQYKSRYTYRIAHHLFLSIEGVNNQKRKTKMDKATESKFIIISSSKHFTPQSIWSTTIEILNSLFDSVLSFYINKSFYIKLSFNFFSLK